MFESILNGPVDSADEMSFIYDVYSETEVLKNIIFDNAPS